MAMTKTKRRKRPARSTGQPDTTFVDFLKLRMTTGPEAPRSHAEFLAEMRAKQAAGQLANPATAALLDRLERVIR